jgi:hypothetical protein
MKKTIFVLFVLICVRCVLADHPCVPDSLVGFRVNGIFDKSGNLLYPGLKHYLEEYEALNPGIKIEIREVPFGNYLPTILVRAHGRQSGGHLQPVLSLGSTTSRLTSTCCCS